MKEIIKILEIEEKIAKNNRPFLRVKLETGWLSSFDVKVNAELKQSINKELKVITAEKDGFKNILGIIHNELEDRASEVVEQIGVHVNNNYKLQSKDCAMFTSYTKDVFLSLVAHEDAEPASYPAFLNTSIDLVKRMREAFL